MFVLRSSALIAVAAQALAPLTLSTQTLAQTLAMSAAAETASAEVIAVLPSIADDAVAEAAPSGNATSEAGEFGVAPEKPHRRIVRRPAPGTK